MVLQTRVNDRPFQPIDMIRNQQQRAIYGYLRKFISLNMD
jgi:hypothetical protein